MARFERLINAYARLNGLSPDLLHAVIRTESAYNHEAVSHAGAQGLMQLMPGTAARYGVKDSFNPVENLRGGAAYLRDLLDMFGQDLTLALAGYNAGENAVIRNGYQIPPYNETQNYVRQVLQHLSTGRAGDGAARLSSQTRALTTTSVSIASGSIAPGQSPAVLSLDQRRDRLQGPERPGQGQPA